MLPGLSCDPVRYQILLFSSHSSTNPPWGLVSSPPLSPTIIVGGFRHGILILQVKNVLKRHCHLPPSFSSSFQLFSLLLLNWFTSIFLQFFFLPLYPWSCQYSRIFIWNSFLSFFSLWIHFTRSTPAGPSSFLLKVAFFPYLTDTRLKNTVP